MVAALLAVAVGVVILLSWWDWKTLIGWRALVDYIDPEDATGRKDAVQVYAVIVAGMVAAITAAVGLANLRLTRKNLEQQRKLEADRAKEQRALEAHRHQSAALQAYYEQMGKLLTEHDLSNTERDDIRLLARAQTIVILEGLDASRKRDLILFLHKAGLIKERFGIDKDPILHLGGANLCRIDLSRVDLSYAVFNGVDLSYANFSGSFLPHASFFAANLRGANFSGAKIIEEDQLAPCQTLVGATMRNGQKYEDWVKTAEKKIPQSLD